MWCLVCHIGAAPDRLWEQAQCGADVYNVGPTLNLFWTSVSDGSEHIVATPQINKTNSGQQTAPAGVVGGCVTHSYVSLFTLPSTYFPTISFPEQTLQGSRDHTQSEILYVKRVLNNFFLSLQRLYKPRTIKVLSLTDFKIVQLSQSCILTNGAPSYIHRKCYAFGLVSCSVCMSVGLYKIYLPDLHDIFTTGVTLVKEPSFTFWGNPYTGYGLRALISAEVCSLFS